MSLPLPLFLTHRCDGWSSWSYLGPSSDFEDGTHIRIKQGQGTGSQMTLESHYQPRLPNSGLLGEERYPGPFRPLVLSPLSLATECNSSLIQDEAVISCTRQCEFQNFRL